MVSSGFDLCIKCDRGGEVLVCKGEDCPVVVHEKCMGCRVSYGVGGEFDCPYCVSRNAYGELKQAREDVRLMKRGLSAFIDSKMGDCGEEGEVSERGKGKRKGVLGEVENVESLIQEENGSKGVDSVQDVQLCGEANDVVRGNGISRGGGGEAFGVNGVEGTVEDQVCRRVDGLIFHKDVEDDRENANLIGSPSVQENPGEGQKDDLKSLEENDTSENSLGKTASSIESDSMVGSGADGGGETSNKRSKGRKAKIRCAPPSAKVNCDRRLSPIMRKNPRKSKRINIAREVSQKIVCPGGRRVLWTEQEEEMIKEGVIRYTSTENKNIPWRKIFDFGRHVFHYSRTPVHLKDKWRTMLAKEN